MNQVVGEIVLNCHNKAIAQGQEGYQYRLNSELLSKMEYEFGLKLSANLKRKFERGFLDTKIKLENRIGRRLKMGEFLKETTTYTDFFIHKVKHGIIK